MKDYEEELNASHKRNEKFLSEFEEWLKKKGLGEKTIRNHISNVDLFINDYLNYYDFVKAEDGIYEVCMFLNGWFIEKCAWASKSTIKQTAASLKKFYQYMSENNYVTKDVYNDFCDDLKNRMEDFYISVDAYDDGTYFDMFDF